MLHPSARAEVKIFLPPDVVFWRVHTSYSAMQQPQGLFVRSHAALGLPRPLTFSEGASMIANGMLVIIQEFFSPERQLCWIEVLTAASCMALFDRHARPLSRCEGAAKGAPIVLRAYAEASVRRGAGDTFQPSHRSGRSMRKAANA
jgi:hypothetical protein